ncbi:unnamed protein product [Urochloa humidicola]
MQTLVNHLGAQAQGQQRRGHPAFLATDPPIFKETKEPLDADFWLNTIEDKFGLFPCNDNEKVTFAAHQLRDAAGAWWKNYKAQVVENHVITWAEFREAFRAHHIPEGILELKREEFLSLTQGNKLVREYAHAFNYLSQYAKEDVSTNAKKRYRFMKGLSLKLKNHLSATDFNDYNHMVSKAIMFEASMNELEADNNRKRVAPSSSSYGGGSQRARMGPPPPPRVPGYGAPQPMWMARRPPAPQAQAQAPRSTGQPGGGGGFGPRGPCYNCGGQGHISRECPSPKKGGTSNVLNQPQPNQPPRQQEQSST